MATDAERKRGILLWCLLRMWRRRDARHWQPKTKAYRRAVGGWIDD